MTCLDSVESLTSTVSRMKANSASPTLDRAARIEAFREGGGAGKPVHIQHTISWADTQDEAMASALDQWAPVAIGGEINWDIRRPSDFDHLARFVDEEHIGRSVRVSADPGLHRADLQAFAELGVDTVFVHNVGRNQDAFIDMAARELVG